MKYGVLPPLQEHVAPEFKHLALQTQMCKAMLQMEPQDAIGVACSLLLLMSMRQPAMLRRVLQERVIHEGFSGVSLIDTLTRVCK